MSKGLNTYETRINFLVSYKYKKQNKMKNLDKKILPLLNLLNKCKKEIERLEDLETLMFCSKEITARKESKWDTLEEVIKWIEKEMTFLSEKQMVIDCAITEFENEWRERNRKTN